MKQEQTQQKTPAKSTPGENLRPLQEGVERATGLEREPRQVYHCANCDIEFFWAPTVVKGHVYCCSGCAGGGPCTCDYSLYRSVTIMGVIHYE